VSLLFATRATLLVLLISHMSEICATTIPGLRLWAWEAVYSHCLGLGLQLLHSVEWIVLGRRRAVCDVGGLGRWSRFDWGVDHVDGVR